jgi:hypothetical protein
MSTCVCNVRLICDTHNFRFSQNTTYVIDGGGEGGRRCVGERRRLAGSGAERRVGRIRRALLRRAARIAARCAQSNANRVHRTRLCSAKSKWSFRNEPSGLLAKTDVSVFSILLAIERFRRSSVRMRRKAHTKSSVSESKFDSSATCLYPSPFADWVIGCRGFFVLNLK